MGQKRKLREKRTIKHPFAINWSIQKSLLESLKNSDDFIDSPIFKVPSIFGVQYHLRIYPSQILGASTIPSFIVFLRILNGIEKEVYGEFTLQIKTANYMKNFVFNYHPEDPSIGIKICSREHLLNFEHGYIIDEELILQVYGIIKVFRSDYPALAFFREKKKPKITTQSVADAFIQNIPTDFAFFVQGYEMNIHKSILMARSEVFKEMFQRGFIDEKITIDDFGWETVEAARRLCYDQIIDEDEFSLHLGFELIRFFDKYLMTALKDFVEDLIIQEIDVINLWEVANFSESYSLFRLKNACIKFLKSCAKRKIMVADIDEISETFASGQFKLSSFCHYSHF